jgi:outer membrane translocation and assembly module TamA
MFRVKQSDFFAGLKYIYLTTDNTFDTSELFPDAGLSNVEFDSTSAGLGVVLQYEGLNNTITPSSGLKAHFEANDYGDTWGGDSDFNKYRLFANYWFPVESNWVVGLRADASAVSGDAPFYEYPYIDLRGIPALRYQGEETLVGETEVRYDFTSRWSAIGFVGAGKALSDQGQGDSETVVSKGVGFRYLVARRFGMRAGIDVAWGPEDTAFYIQVGSAWGR